MKIILIAFDHAFKLIAGTALIVIAISLADINDALRLGLSVELQREKAKSDWCGRQ